MPVMKVYNGTSWDSTFTPATYGLDDDGGGSPSAFNKLDGGTVKVWTGTEWIQYWPPTNESTASSSGEPLVQLLPASIDVLAENVSGDTTAAIIINVADIWIKTQENLGSKINETQWTDDPGGTTKNFYEARIDVTSGSGLDPTSTKAGQWFDLTNIASELTWFIIRPGSDGDGTTTSNLILQIREKLYINNSASVPVTLSAEIGPI